MQKIRNIAIIAHVDHGKTTLVDKMLLAGHLFRDNENTGELIMDNNDLERERGLRFLLKRIHRLSGDTKLILLTHRDTPTLVEKWNVFWIWPIAFCYLSMLLKVLCLKPVSFYKKRYKLDLHL